MRITGRRKTTSHAWKKQGPGKNSACPLISSRSPRTRSDQSEPTFAGIRPTDVPPVRAAQIVGARFAFFVSLAHVKDRLKQGDGVFESGLGNRRQIAQLLGKSLVSIRLQMRCFDATEELLTNKTNENRSVRTGQCELANFPVFTAWCSESIS